MKILDLFLFAFKIKTKKNILFYKPCSIVISKHASVMIDKECKCLINKSWSLKRSIHNKKTGEFFLEDYSTFICKNFTSFVGSTISVHNKAILNIGNNCYVNHDSRIECYNKIIIGDDSIIGENVYIRDSNSHLIIDNSFIESAPIIIGKHVWIGSRAIILPGVSIGDNVVVAAGSIVNKSVPSNCMVAGCPAKIVKEDIHWK